MMTMRSYLPTLGVCTEYIIKTGAQGVLEIWSCLPLRDKQIETKRDVTLPEPLNEPAANPIQEPGVSQTKISSPSNLLSASDKDLSNGFYAPVVLVTPIISSPQPH